MSFISKKWDEQKGEGKTFKFKTFEKTGKPFFITETNEVFSNKNYETALSKNMITEGDNGEFTVKGEMKKMPNGVMLILTNNSGAANWSF